MSPAFNPEQHVIVPDDPTQCHGTLARHQSTALARLCDEDKKLPLMRVTAVTGIVMPGSMDQITSARTNCDVLKPAGTRSGTLARTVCVVVSTDGEMKLIDLVASGVPASSTSRTGKPIFS